MKKSKYSKRLLIGLLSTFLMSTSSFAESYFLSIFRIVPGNSRIEDVSQVCTLTKQPLLCEVAYPPAGGVYYTDVTLTSSIPSRYVYLIP